MKQKWSELIIREFAAHPRVQRTFRPLEIQRKECVFEYVGTSTPVLLRLQVVENELHCGFVIACLVGCTFPVPEGLLAIDLPDEVANRKRGAFDIGLLFGRHAFRWSVLNDSLDMANDGALRGAPETIHRRLKEAVSDAVTKIEQTLVPFVETTLSRTGP